MGWRSDVARYLVAGAAAGLIATAVLHLKDYWTDTQSASAVGTRLQAEFRAMHLLVGWQWIVIAVVALLAAFSDASVRWIIVFFCGVAVLVEAALTLAHMGVFLGTELMAVTGILLIGGGLLFRSA